ERGFDANAVARASQRAAAPNRPRDAIERRAFLGLNNFGGHLDFGRVLQQALRARLDSLVAGLTRDFDDARCRRRHQGCAVQIDRRHYFSRMTPNVSPATRYLRATTIRTSGTDMAITPDAAMS